MREMIETLTWCPQNLIDGVIKPGLDELHGLPYQLNRFQLQHGDPAWHAE